MRDQWFGDKKDVFKFGIILELLKGIGLKKFTWIAMKTRDEEGEPYEDFSCIDRDLRKFFFDLRKPKYKPKLCMIRDFLDRRKDIDCFLIEDTFKAEKREEYFRKIFNNKDALTNAFILIDPDNGFETDFYKDKSDKHILFREVNCIFIRMEGSILAVFQHQQRGKSYNETFRNISNKPNDWLSNSFYFCVMSSKAQSMMFLLFKNKELGIE